MAPLPLRQDLSWSPFRLDALGLVTLIGAEEVCLALGAMQFSWLTSFLPVLGSYLVASNRFTQPLSGYTAFNISDGIIPPELNGTFTRWLDNHINTGARRGKGTVWLEFEMPGITEERLSWWRKITAFLISLVLNGLLITMAVLLRDWYGLANALAMVISVLVRVSLIDQHETKLHDLVQQARRSIYKGDNKDSSEQSTPAKLVIDAPNSNKLAVCFVPRPIIKPLLATFAHSDQKWYRASRLIGWGAFAVHVVSIGQSCLISQLLAISILAGSTVATIFRIGIYDKHCTEADCQHKPCTGEEKCDHSMCKHENQRIQILECKHESCGHQPCDHVRCDLYRCEHLDFGQWIRVKSMMIPDQPRRDCYIAMNPTPTEEEALQKWFLMPLTTNTAWYDEYWALKQKRNETNEITTIRPKAA